MRELILVLTATRSKDEAQTIADLAVDKQLVAAVQIIGPITSTYRWQNKTERAEEWLCLLKTSRDLYEELERIIQATHSYEVPGILALPVATGSKQYLEWYDGELRKQETLKEQLLNALNEAHEKLIAAATTAASRGVVREGGWGPREVLAHIAAWEAEATKRIPLLAEGAAPLTYDDDAFNAAMIAMLGDQSFEQICDTLRQVHLRLMSTLTTLKDSVFTPGGSVYERVKAMSRHSEEHARELNVLV